jgi:hypothetical protein
MYVRHNIEDCSCGKTIDNAHSEFDCVTVVIRGFVCVHFVTKIRFHGEELSAPRLTPKLVDHTMSAVRDCLFNIIAATLHIGGRFSIRKTHAVVTGIHWSCLEIRLQDEVTV